MLQEAIKAVNAAGWKLSLCENNSGKWRWSAMALGDHPQMGPNGALYTRAGAFGNTPEEALKNLIAEVEAKRAEDDCSDLV